MITLEEAPVLAGRRSSLLKPWGRPLRLFALRIAHFGRELDMRFRFSPLLIALFVFAIAFGSRNLNSQTLGWNTDSKGDFERKTYPPGMPADFASAHREANAMAARWNPAARLFRVDFRMAPPLPNPPFNDHGMFEAYLYYFAPGASSTSWNGLQIRAALSYGNAPFAITATKFDGNPPYPSAAPENLVDPAEALRRINLNPDGFLKQGVHLKAAGSPVVDSSNFGVTNGPLERFIDHTIPAGKYVWWTEFHPGNGKNQYIYLDATTGQATVVPQL